jgi:hypothetical protein
MESIQFDSQIDLRVNIASFLNFMGMDCKFLNFGVNIEKTLILHGLKVNFPLYLPLFFCLFLGKTSLNPKIYASFANTPNV